MSETTRIVYGNSSVRRDDRDERPLGERAVADVAALGPAHEAGLPDREGREVVVVPVEAVLLQAERVEPHLLLERAERGDGQRLRLAAREERRAVRARGDADLDGDLADLLRRAAVGPLLVDGDALADRRLLDLRERGRGGGALLGVGRRPRDRRRSARGSAVSTAFVASWRSSLSSTCVALSRSAPCEALMSAIRPSSMTGASTTIFSLRRPWRPGRAGAGRAS